MLRKLLMVVLGISLVLAAGSCNIYPLYMTQMMDKFDFTVKEANLYGSFVNLGLWMAFTMGLVYDKFGPKISCIIGAVLLSGSYAFLHLIMNSDLTSISLIPLLLIALVMGQGSALCYTTAVTSNLKNFHSNNSAIVGLLVSNMAISPSIFTTYKQALPNIRIANYFLMISVFLGIVVLACGWGFTNLKEIYSEHDKYKEYQRYKERKIIRLLVLLNIFILAIYTFGVIFNNLNSEENRFPNVIIYPCLQLLNFLFIILEKFGVWEKLYFTEFIEKEIRRKLKLDDHNENLNISNKKDNESSNNNKESCLNNITPVRLAEEKSAYDTPSHSIIPNPYSQSFNKINTIASDSPVVNQININVNNVIQIINNNDQGINQGHGNNYINNNYNIENIDKREFNSGSNLNNNSNRNNPNQKGTIEEDNQNVKISNNKNTDNKKVKRKNSLSGYIKHTKTNVNFDTEKENDTDVQVKSNITSRDDKQKNKIRNLFERNISTEENENNKEKIKVVELEKRGGNIEDYISPRNPNMIANPINNDTTNIENIESVIPNSNLSEFSKFLIIIKNKELLILFIILIFGIGSVISNINNIQFIITSVTRSPTSNEIFDYAVLYFVFNSFFRILSGLVIDTLIEKQKTFYFVLIVSCIGLLSQLLGVTMNKDLLFISVGLAGASHGGYMTFCPIYCKKFGMENMGKVLGFLTTGCAIGSILVSDIIFTFFYDLNKSEGKCIGKKCFENAYIITSFLFLINVLLSLIILRNQKKNKV